MFTQDGFDIAECAVCGHQQCANPVDVRHLAREYGDNYFSGGGAGYRDYLGESDLLLDHGRRYAKLLATYCEPATALDIGCAAGLISQAFAQSGWQTTSVDPNPAMVAHARDCLGLAAYVGALEQLESIPGFKPPEVGFDLIVMIQVIAHFFDLERALTMASKLTRPGGLCLIETWDSSSLTARTLGRRWHEYSPPTVLHYFSRSSLARLMERHGFQAIATGRPRKLLRLDHAASLLRHKYGQSIPGRALCSLVDALPGKMEIPYPSEDLFWTLFRRDGEHSGKYAEEAIAA